jgi:hypothetical protein
LVVIAPPPPNRTPKPIIVTVPAGTSLVRLFDPTRHGATALAFRFFGPLRRFDHQRGSGPECDPADDPERGIAYLGGSHETDDGLSCCIVEVFGDTGIVAFGEWHVAAPLLLCDLRLLDVRKRCAMRAGTVRAIDACEHGAAQPWARYFYEQESLYTRLDGIAYANAHNGDTAIALFERAQDALACPPDRVLRLDYPALRPRILAIMRENNLSS